MLKQNLNPDLCNSYSPICDFMQNNIYVIVVPCFLYFVFLNKFFENNEVETLLLKNNFVNEQTEAKILISRLGENELSHLFLYSVDSLYENASILLYDKNFYNLLVNGFKYYGGEKTIANILFNSPDEIKEDILKIIYATTGECSGEHFKSLNIDNVALQHFVESLKIFKKQTIF